MLIIVLTLRNILYVLVVFVKSVKAVSGLLYEEDSERQRGMVYEITYEQVYGKGQDWNYHELQV